jgi:hypothetical protein
VGFFCKFLAKIKRGTKAKKINGTKPPTGQAQLKSKAERKQRI